MNKHQIFVVDDSQIQLILIRKMLTRKGFSVQTFLSGYKMTKALTVNSPQLIISDIDMPGMDGFELIQKVRSRPNSPYIPFFLISSNGGSDILKKVERAGAEAFLQKPFKYQALTSIVSEKVNPAKV